MLRVGHLTPRVMPPPAPPPEGTRRGCDYQSSTQKLPREMSIHTSPVDVLMEKPQGPQSATQQLAEMYAPNPGLVDQLASIPTVKLQPTLPRSIQEVVMSQLHSQKAQ